MREEVFTYHNGRVTRQAVETVKPTEDLVLLPEDEQEDPIFTSIMKQVKRAVQQSQQESR